MKKYIIIAVAFISLIATCGIAFKKARQYKENWQNAAANVKAYDKLLSNEKEKNAAFRITVDQLEYFQDSVLQALNKTREELKIKDKNLKALQYVSSDFERIDTVIFTDTLFVEPSLALDTVLGDEWYKAKIGLRYPASVIVNPEFKSKKHIVVATKKETINPPKKLFIARWFQKKHLVLQLYVEEQNPYVNDEESRYFEIIK